MTATDDLSLFDPAFAGLPAESWDELEATAAPHRPKCSECERPLRSRESQQAEIGPCCAAKIGRAVVARRRKAAAAGRAPRQAEQAVEP